ncbi:M28 family metallopeptidase [Aestuariibacter salexigens]|uniref:M28 family metallopeptidase n=1 Tax=Aestuariibacter salexigens TaxID=226010 RepID=UPI001F0A35BA|nr:M28 family metallopeptidase [Aestuariibacter salexigens]
MAHVPYVSADNHVQPDIAQIQSHLWFLSHDLLEGRETGSIGHEFASLYIAAEMKKYGLVPAGDNGSYFQRVKFRQAFLDQASPRLDILSGDERISLSYPKDFTMGPGVVRTEDNVTAPLVFVGYGIVAPELQHDDYADVDVTGKIVVNLAGKPASFPSEEGAHFASGSQKQKYAVERGAIGVITITTPSNEKVRPYQNLLNYLHTPRVRWLQEDGTPASVYPQLKGGAYLSLHAAERLFKTSPVPLQDIYQMLEQGRVPSGFDLPVSVTLHRKSEHKSIQSPNVVGILPGSDPVLKDEYVVYSAHSDHIGLAKTVKQDNINNGAMDNASGTSVMLETARMFSQLPQAPKRSLLFVAVTGEEKGLLGADYFARNPTVPEGSMVANVNLDMPILTYEFADVIAFGASHSDMKKSVEQAAARYDISLSPDPWPQQALFTRSDHYAFVKQGIPAVFLVPGLQSADPEVDGSKVFGEFISTHYHKPSDQFDLPFNWRAAEKFTQVNFEIGRTLADQSERSQWNEGDFFGETFAK